MHTSHKEQNKKAHAEAAKIGDVKYAPVQQARIGKHTMHIAQKWSALEHKEQNNKRGICIVGFDRGNS